jgi:hypothetical protein
MSACRRHYPGRTDGTDSLITAPSTSAFPRLQLGQLLHYQFRGLLSVHLRYDLQTRQVALCDPLHRRLRRLCCLHRRSDCYRVERSSSRAGLSSRCGSAPFTAHCNRLITPAKQCAGKPGDGRRDSPPCYCSFAYSALASFRIGMSGSTVFPEGEEISDGQIRASLLRQPHFPHQFSKPWVGADGVENEVSFQTR